MKMLLDMWNKISLLLNTLRFLKKKQVIGQICRRLKQSKYLTLIKREIVLSKGNISFRVNKVEIGERYRGLNTFVFLNLAKKFEGDIDWNYLDFGKLWNYNLEYFDYLYQGETSIEDRDRLIADFYCFSIRNKRTLEPYPVSLRVINILKYAIRENRQGEAYLEFVYRELTYLHHNYEFHILGNHLLENAFAMCLGGAFFKEGDWHNKAKCILYEELDEQILEDGAHFELSPMYHNIIFFRLLELIDWYELYDERDNDFLKFCQSKASKMFDWLESIRFKNGDIPLFNDSAKGIALEAVFLINYAKMLGIQRNFISLADSGYRSIENRHYETKIDLAQIGAAYQPGHAHADALSFILYQRGKAVFVEQGTSTYQVGKRRNLERSTEAHNTVVLNGINQSQVWGGFRVGKRAETVIHRETNNLLEASHNGYKKFSVIHNRKFLFYESRIQITDSLSKEGNAKAYLHLHPDRHLFKKDDNHLIIDNDISILLNGAKSIDIEKYEYAETYNLYHQAKRLVISFNKELSTTILFERS